MQLLHGQGAVCHDDFQMAPPVLFQGAAYCLLSLAKPHHPEKMLMHLNPCCAAILLTAMLVLYPTLLALSQRNHLQDMAQAVQLDWGELLPAVLQPPYDIVLCSDVVYSPASVRPLLSTLSALTGPDSTVLYACEFREGAGLELLHQLLPEYHLKEQLVSHCYWSLCYVEAVRAKRASDACMLC